MPNFGEQATGSRKDEFEKAEISLDEIKNTQVGDLSLEELQALVAKRQKLSGEKKAIADADHAEALGMEECRNVALAEAARAAEQAKQEAMRLAEEKAASEAVDAAQAEALLVQIKGGGETSQAEENGTNQKETIAEERPIEERLEAPKSPMFEKYGSIMRQAATELVEVCAAMRANGVAQTNTESSQELKKLQDEWEQLRVKRSKLLGEATQGHKVIEFEAKSSDRMTQIKYENGEMEKYLAAAMSDPKTVILLAEAGELGLDYRQKKISESLSSNVEFMTKLLKSLPNRTASENFWPSCTGEARKSKELYIAAIRKNHLNYQFGPREWTTDPEIQTIALESGLSQAYLQK